MQQQLGTDVGAVVRLRAGRPPVPAAGDAVAFAPLAFTFLDQGDAALPGTLLPPPVLTPSTPARSLPPSPATRPTGAGPGATPPSAPVRRPTNYQDVLLFDPAEGVLSLRRAMLERRAEAPGALALLSPSSSLGSGVGTTMSLPAMSTLARFGSSPPARGAPGTSPSAQGASGLTQMMDRPGELVGRESVVATWSLRRGRDWREVKTVLRRAAPADAPRPSRLGRPQ
jgi:hypothetical protein